MVCKNCNVAMNITGTSYRRKDGRHGTGFSYKKFCQCPKCGKRSYGGQSSFHHIISEEFSPIHSKT